MSEFTKVESPYMGYQIEIPVIGEYEEVLAYAKELLSDVVVGEFYLRPLLSYAYRRVDVDE